VTLSKLHVRLGLITAAVLFGFVFLVVRYGDHLDPTENVFVVSLHNDLGQPVTISLCDNGPCSRVSHRAHVPVGRDVKVPAVDIGLADEYRVDARDGITLGCIRLQFYNRDLVRLNLREQLTPCPT
jgi:hypothetical protein